MRLHPGQAPGSRGSDVMRETSRVFFVVNNKGVAHLAANPKLLADIDCVISAVPGVSLDRLDGTIARMTFEEALADFNISQRRISEPESAYSHYLLDPSAMAGALPILVPSADDSIRLALLNHVGLLTHNAFAFEVLFKALIGNGLDEAVAFRARGRFRMIERPDIRTLLHVDLGFWPHLSHLCLDHKVQLTGVGSGGWLAPAKNALRDLMLLGYKGKTLLTRSRRAARPVPEIACDLAVVVRARTEVIAADPILDARAEQGRRDLMLVDDLIKSPDGTRAATDSGRRWVPLHSFSRPLEIARVFARCIAFRRKAARKAMALRPDRAAAAGFLGRSEIAQEVLYTAFASVPELLVHHLQLSRALDRLKPNALVSFDTVDRWGALQGEVARKARLRSVMIQNTAVDDIVYPWPLAMDHLVVGNERLREIFVASGADPQRVHAFGLPLHDEVLKAGDERLQALLDRALQGETALRVLIATQPFVQEFDYNTALVEDLEPATGRLDFPVEWVLKPHPREVMARYTALREALVARSISVTLFDGPFEKALSAAELVLSRTSTSLEFAMLGGVPGIAHLESYPADIIDRLDYLKSSVTEKSFDRDGLRSLLERFAPNNRHETLHRYARTRSVYLDRFFPGQGRATQRVLDLIETGTSSC